MKPSVSTLIPVLNDAPALRRCLIALQACDQSEQNEIIVADGGSSEECRAICTEFNAIWIGTQPGRAHQMNRAAELATTNLFWFLHADCVPDPQSITALLDLDNRVQWGCFAHRIDARSPWLRIIESADNLRAKLSAMPYGDQGIFVRSNAFESAGRYDEVPLLEDVLLARKLAEFSAPRILKPILKTDARRWLKNGIAQTTLLNWRIMFEFLITQKSPEELEKLYRKPR